MRVLNSSLRLGPALVALFFLWVTSVASLPVAQAQTKSAQVNVNTADLATLETLPGVGPATAQKIIDNRPYKSATDLEKVPGLSEAKVNAMKDQITFKSGSKSKSTSSTSTDKESAHVGKVNVNTADVATLETLPGVGAATAQHIIDGRPYHSAADLEKVHGLSKAKVEAMQDQITFGKSHASTSTSDKSSGTTTHSESSKSSSKEMQPTGHESGKLAPGQKVNINTASAEQLDNLFGIGPVKSQAIVDYRNEHGKFQSIEDVMNVSGIKQGEFNKIKDQITVK